MKKKTIIKNKIEKKKPKKKYQPKLGMMMGKIIMCTHVKWQESETLGEYYVLVKRAYLDM